MYVMTYLYLAGTLCAECILSVSDPSLPYPSCCSCIASNLNRSRGSRGNRICACSAVMLCKIYSNQSY